MRKFLHLFLRKVKPAYVLTGLFLVYIFYICACGFSTFLYNSGSALYWDSGYAHYIQTVNEQYEGFLTTEQEKPLLQNKGTYINLNGLMANVMGQREMNERVVLKNGHLASPTPWVTAPDSVRAAAENVIRFHQKQQEKGGHFLFVMVPSQISKYEDLLPTGYTDSFNETADLFLSYLRDAGVPCLDLREAMAEAGISAADGYFVTDHHWKPQTGFWAYTKILEALAQTGAIDPVDNFYTNVQNYTFQTYENCFLGSSGKRTGKYYAGTDDFSFIIPSFHTDVSVTVESQNVDLRGKFEDVAYGTDIYARYPNPDYFQDDPYNAYGWGNTPLTRWRNPLAPQEGKFLLIGESFGNVPYSLLSLYLSACDEMDMRYYDGDFAAYYEAYAPDTVVMEVNVTQTVAEITTYPYVSP